MENASEALKMATGVLIAIMIIGIIVFEFNSISQLENDKEDQKELCKRQLNLIRNLKHSIEALCMGLILYQL